ncbi:hypothetical protein GIB67_019601 [Kingdonia uniflora]|uniref:Uncharacterized protein n=1 Tax=Kingdonia uniflora TaxID=39325 RepID=A0A7J7N0E1_9MAGN|nr:hypothetical protein GIB67_019601 [Kingdonia uniflora]
MEDALTKAPPLSRFFEENLNNFTPKSPPLPPPFLLLNPNLLIISISPPSLHHFPSKTLIGTVIAYFPTSTTTSLKIKYAITKTIILLELPPPSIPLSPTRPSTSTTIEPSSSFRSNARYYPRDPKRWQRYSWMGSGQRRLWCWIRFRAGTFAKSFRLTRC